MMWSLLASLAFGGPAVGEVEASVHAFHVGQALEIGAIVLGYTADEVFADDTAAPILGLSAAGLGVGMAVAQSSSYLTTRRLRSMGVDVNPRFAQVGLPLGVIGASLYGAAIFLPAGSSGRSALRVAGGLTVGLSNYYARRQIGRNLIAAYADEKKERKNCRIGLLALHCEI